MGATSNLDNVDAEAKALAACYRLLLQKAAERHARLVEQEDPKDEIQSRSIPNREFEQDRER